MPTFDLSASLYRKPSVAVRAAIHGLNTRKNDPSFVLNMATFGRGDAANNDSRICVGCMATVSLEAVTNTRLTSDVIFSTNLRAVACNTDVSDVDTFERAMNDLRCNNATPLYNFCQVFGEDRNSLPWRVSDRPGYVLDGQPSDSRVNFTIKELTTFAELLEAKGF